MTDLFDNIRNRKYASMQIVGLGCYISPGSSIRLRRHRIVRRTHVITKWDWPAGEWMNITFLGKDCNLLYTLALISVLSQARDFD
jgi:hypothetical protein